MAVKLNSENCRKTLYPQLDWDVHNRSLGILYSHGLGFTHAAHIPDIDSNATHVILTEVIRRTNRPNIPSLKIIELDVVAACSTARRKVLSDHSSIGSTGVCSRLAITSLADLDPVIICLCHRDTDREAKSSNEPSVGIEGDQHYQSKPALDFCNVEHAQTQKDRSFERRSRYCKPAGGHSSSSRPFVLVCTEISMQRKGQKVNDGRNGFLTASCDSLLFSGQRKQPFAVVDGFMILLIRSSSLTGLYAF